MDITISANAVAWYAALVGTGSLAVSAVDAWRDRARVKVTATAGYKISKAVLGYSPDKLYISVTVANLGRRPVSISNVWLDTTDPQHEHGHLLLDDSILRGPRDLPEGKATSYYVDQTELDLTKITRVVASDETGRKWQSKLRRD
jgi:hypothetical protein